ncbi:hypothetical protein PR048_015347 [Dryococelus australis]|uniref:RING-type domain-containing protein n=1 Tax=Dryococelus australis TaxID=614101 RepID=A0ABQ9HGP5_9NEOP|nr:hypothetical protein PR048_015347 [Dryococelus australis]
MVVNCVICSDNIDSTSDAYSTRCGHVFHFVCLIGWLERSKTCPQCRNETSENDIHRLYLHTSNESEVQDGLLWSQIERLRSDIKRKELEAKTALETVNGLR